MYVIEIKQSFICNITDIYKIDKIKNNNWIEKVQIEDTNYKCYVIKPNTSLL